jgi:YVTN family beta-propeller protein
MAYLMKARTLVALLALCSACRSKTAESSTAKSAPKPFTRESVLEDLRNKYPAVHLPADTLPNGVSAHENVVYARRGRDLALDLYRPSAETGRIPALIVVHGGGWERGDRKMERPLAKRLAALGYVTATVSYRLGPEGRFPNALQDLKASVRWLRANADKYGIDPGRIGAIGGSAGGQLVALLGASNGVLRFEGEDNREFSSAVQAVVGIDGLADFAGPALLAKEAKDPGAPTRFLGGSFPQRTGTWKEASAISHAGAGSPPMLFINSTAPTPILPGRPEMCEALKKLAVECIIAVLPDTPHPFWLLDPWFQRTVDLADEFFKKHLAEVATGKTLLILDKWSQALGAYDPRDGRRRGGTLAVGSIPHEMALSPDGRHLYIANYGVKSYTDAEKGDNAVSIVDLEKKAKIGEIDLGKYHRPHGIEFGHSGRLYVTVDFPPGVLALDPEARRVAQAYLIEHKLPHNLALSKDESRVYLANSGSASVSVIALDQKTRDSDKAVDVGGVPMGLALSPDERRLYVANRTGNAVVVVDTASLKVTHRIPVPGEPVRVTRVPGRRLLLATLIVSGDAVLIDTEALRVTERLHVGNRLEGLFVDPSGRRAYVSAQADNQVIELSIPGLAVARSIATGDRPDPLLIVPQELAF